MSSMVTNKWSIRSCICLSSDPSGLYFALNSS